MADKIVIRPVGTDERAVWEPLWDGYIAFYKATLEPGASDVAWQRFHDPDEPMFLLGAYVDGKLPGIVQYLFHRSTWTSGNYCYLQDLFVADGARGLGLGRALIEAVYQFLVANDAEALRILDEGRMDGVQVLLEGRAECKCVTEQQLDQRPVGFVELEGCSHGSFEGRRRTPVAGRCPHGIVDVLAQRSGLGRHELVEEGLFRLVVPVDGAVREARLASDVGNGRGVIAAFGKDLLGR